MQKWLDGNDFSMYQTYNAGKSVVAERYVRTLKGKIDKKITANYTKSYLDYLNNLVDEYNNTYHCYIGKKPIHADHSVLTGEIESRHKRPRFKVGDRVRITKYKNIFSKGHNKNWSKEIFVIDSVLKTNPWMYKIKDLNEETILGSLYEKELLLIILKISYYPKPNSHTTDKVKVEYNWQIMLLKRIKTCYRCWYV